jgi:TetR/AcrR family transcriptional regulator, repressor for uid operon
MGTMRKQPLDRRDAILRAARNCFIKNGFHATGMAEICVEAGMSPGNLYRYFQSKSAIIQAIADETRTRILPVFAQLRTHQDPVEGIVEIIVHSVREFCRGTDGRLWMEILAEASRNSDIRKLCIAFDQQVRDCLKELLRRVAEANRLLMDLDIEATSVWLIALLDGAIARVSMDPDVDLARTLETLAGSIRRWLRVQPA